VSRFNLFACAAVALTLVGSGCSKGVLNPGGGGNPTGGGWVQQNPPVHNDLLAVSFADTLHGWAVGAAAILHTSDGGRTWVNQMQNAPRQGLIYSGASAPDSNHCWVVSESDGSIQATADGGRSWMMQDAGSGGALFAVAFTDTSHGWACGQRVDHANALIRYTQTGGTVWQDAQTTGIPILYALGASPFRLMACGVLGTVATSDALGQQWQKTPLTGTTQQLQAIAILPSSGGLSAVAGGVAGVGSVLTSTDGGASWGTGQPLPAGLDVEGITMASYTAGWLVGSGAGHAEIARTADGGVSWITQAVSWGLPLRGVSAVDTRHVWVVGDGGAIFYTSSGGN